MSAIVEDTNEVPHADYGGDLLAGDKVKISGLTSEKGLKLNGCTGFIVPLNLKNDGTFNPTLACRPDGKYQVRITNTKSGRHMNKMETKVYIMKRKNLNPTKVSPSSIHRMEGGKAALEKANIHMGTTAEHEANLPVELRGLFPAIMQGDHVKLRKILEYLKKTHSCVDAAEHYVDAAGNTAIFGAIEHHHVEILQVLIEYGADVNRCNMIPFIMDLKLSPLIMALMVIETERIMGNRGREILKRMETIVNLLLDAGADPSHHSGKGTPLIVASQITGQHEMRLRLIKRLLDAGADVNASYVPLGGMADTTLLAQITTVNTESYTKEETLEVVKLLLKNGADPGKIIQSSPYEKCTVIQIVASMQMPQILECMLSFPKGRAAVDIPRRDCSPPKRGYNRGDKETSLLLMVGDIHGITKSKLTRECIIILLKYGADPSIEDENGISANKWLNSSKEHIELGKLIKKSKNQDPLTFWEIDPDVQAFIVGSSHHKTP